MLVLRVLGYVLLMVIGLAKAWHAAGYISGGLSLSQVRGDTQNEAPHLLRILNRYMYILKNVLYIIECVV